MLKKVEKDFDNKYGLEKVAESYSYDKPFLLTMIPINFSDRDINGYFSQLMYLMQIRSLNVDSDYTISNVPFDIISGEYWEKIDEIIIKNIPIGDYLSAKKYMHNINIFSYCAGNESTTELLQKIHYHLEQSNYNQDEIKEIMQEIFVLQIVDNNYQNHSFVPIPYATTVIVQDIYDFENDMHVLDFNSDNPFISTMQINGVRYMLYNSFGENSLSEEQREHKFKNDYVLAPVVNAVISLYLIKSISISLSNNSKNDISIYNELQKIIKIAQKFVNDKNKMLEELTIDDKNELNKLLFEEIKRIFQLNIPFKKLTADEKEYLTEKDRAIDLMMFTSAKNVFNDFNKCIELINEIIYTYNNFAHGEIIDQKYLGNSGMKVDVTRENDIVSKLKKLEKNIDYINQQIDDIKLPDKIQSMIKDEFLNKIKLAIETIKSKVYTNEFQRIINDVAPIETKLKK